MRVRAGRSGGGAGEARASSRDCAGARALRGRDRSAHGDAQRQRNVQFSGSRSADVSPRTQGAADYAANVLALAKDEAVTLVDANRRDAAAAVLREKAQQLKAMGDIYQNRRVQELAAPAEPEADRLAREGLSNAGRKIYRAENLQIYNQQATGASGRSGN